MATGLAAAAGYQYGLFFYLDDFCQSSRDDK
jgi:hypothetical protein